MEIITFCNACKRRNAFDSIWNLANAANCCNAANDDDTSNLTIVVEEESVVEFVEQFRKHAHNFPSLEYVIGHLSKLPLSSSILYLVILSPHVVAFTLSIKSCKRTALAGYVDDLYHETISYLEDSVLYYIGTGLCSSEQQTESNGSKRALFPLDDLVADDDPNMHDRLMYHNLEVGADGLIDVEFNTTLAGLSEFESLEWGVDSCQVIITIDPADPTKLQCSVFDTSR